MKKLVHKLLNIVLLHIYNLGRNKQDAKQAAAWEAIKNDFPLLEDQVAEEYTPGLYNPGVCNKPHVL